MKASESFAVGLAMLGQLSCAAPQVSGDRREMAPVESLSSVDARHGAESDLDVPALPNEVTQSAAKSAAAVEKCLRQKGGRMALELSPAETYLVEAIRPTGERPEVGMRVGAYFMCDDSNDGCGARHGALPNQFDDSFGPNFERWGLEAMRFHDVNSYFGKMEGADGVAERIFDFNLPPQGGGHEALCMPMLHGNRYNDAYMERRLSNPAYSNRTDLWGCRPPKTPKLTRAYFQELYRGILAKLAKGCADNKVSVPGSQYVRPKFQGGGLGTIDTGGGTGRR